MFYLKKNLVKKNIVKIILILFVFSWNTFYPVKAESTNSTNDDNKIICLNEQGEASTSVFSKTDGLWAPGIDKTKSFYLQNNSTNNCTLNKINWIVSIKDAAGNVIDSSSDRYKNFNNYMNATLVYKGKTLFNGKLSDLLKDEINLKNNITINERSKIKMDLTFSMSSDADSSLQNLIGSIDTSFLFTSLDGSSLVNSLVKTGSMIDTKVLIIVGIIFIGLGGFIITRRKNHSDE